MPEIETNKHNNNICENMRKVLSVYSKQNIAFIEQRWFFSPKQNSSMKKEIGL